jgi:hypothetical protein
MDMHRPAGRITGILLWLVFCTVAAVPIAYDEATDGDLKGTQSLTLDIGSNTVTGSTQWIGTVADHDSVKFVLPAGAILISVAYGFGDVALETGTIGLGSGYNLMDDLTNTLISQASVNVINDSSPASLFVTDLPVAVSNYRLAHSLFRSAGDGGSWDYTLTLAVASPQAVPEPFTLGLLLAGLATAGLVRRR